MANAYIDKIAIAENTYDIQDSTARAIVEGAQASNTVFAGPSSGASASPSFRKIVAADLPIATTSSLGIVRPDGVTVVINEGIISAISSSSSEEINYTAQSITINTNSWSNNTATASVSNMTPVKEVIVSPDSNSLAEWDKSRVYCSSQSANSLIFSCTTTPTATITANILVLEGSTLNANGVSF